MKCSRVISRVKQLNAEYADVSTAMSAIVIRELTACEI
jgi:hypothetical protein